MNKLSAWCALMLLFASVAWAADDGIFPYPTHVERLDNGLKIVVVPMSSGGLASYWTVVRTGSRDEYEPGHSGFAHFFEHMMFRGTDNVPAEVYGQRITTMGANANAFTSDDFTAYYLTVSAEDVGEVMALESDRFRNLAFSEEVFKTEAGAVYGEYRKGRTNPFFVLYEAIRGKAFTTHTYGHTTIGLEADIQAMPTLYDYSRSFFVRYYRPENVVVLVVGDVDPDRVIALARQHYGAWETGYVPPEIPTEPVQQQERQVEVEYPGRTLPLLWVAYKTDAFDAGNRRLLALDLFTSLAFGETSELYRRLVLEEQVVQVLDADADFSRDPGLVDILAQVKDPAKLDEVLSAIDAAIEHYQRELPDAARLADLKSRLKYEFLMDLDSADAVAGNLAQAIALTGGVADIDRLYATYATITPEEVREAARTYLVRDRRTVGILRGKSE